jgi:hypothetical protein
MRRMALVATSLFVTCKRALLKPEKVNQLIFLAHNAKVERQ